MYVLAGSSVLENLLGLCVFCVVTERRARYGSVGFASAVALIRFGGRFITGCFCGAERYVLMVESLLLGLAHGTRTSVSTGLLFVVPVVPVCDNVGVGVCSLTLGADMLGVALIYAGGLCYLALVVMSLGPDDLGLCAVTTGAGGGLLTVNKTGCFLGDLALIPIMSRLGTVCCLTEVTNCTACAGGLTASTIFYGGLKTAYCTAYSVSTVAQREVYVSVSERISVGSLTYSTGLRCCTGSVSPIVT